MGDLKEFGENIWTVDGPIVRDMGILFTTRMALVKLKDGSLWIESPVPVSPETLKIIKALGPVQHLVAATPRHVWRLAHWHSLFPEAQLWTSRPTFFTLKQGKLPPARTLATEAPAAWSDDLDQLVFKGNPLIEEVVFFHGRSRTVVLDDLIQIHPIMKDKPFRNALFKLAGAASPHGGVGLDIRLSFIHRDLARRSLQRLFSWDFDKLIIAHGPCIESNAKVFIERAFQWLM